MSPASLGHLTGRIGELYAAMVTRGQMALAVNQHGYDVVSAEGERISVKTVTSSQHITFNAGTFAAVDRVMILKINVDEDDISIEEILDCSAGEAKGMMRVGSDRFVFPITCGRYKACSLQYLKVVASARYREYIIKQFENGTIIVESDGVQETATKPVLREIAAAVGVDPLNGNGNPKNTRTLGTDVIRALEADRVPSKHQ